MDKKPILGASFSHRHLLSLGIEPTVALDEYRKLNFPWIRLGCYWDEIEKKKGNFNFEIIENLISLSQKLKLKVILTVGMKAPRYPEYYLPKWLERKIKLKEGEMFDSCPRALTSHLENYLTVTVKRLKKYPAIKVWQVENEPLDPSGPHSWQISPRLLKKEIKIVRVLDPSRSILVNLWGNQLTLRNLYPKAVKLGNIVGLDIYFRVPKPFFWRFCHYSGPLDSDEKLRKIFKKIKKSGKSVWLTELQAEPWEPNELVTTKRNPPSCLPKHILQNYERVQNWGLDGALFWGFEWWLYRKIAGDKRYWEEVSKLLKNR